MSERGGPFKKGDPRINRKGRPKTFDAVRELALSIAHETAMSSGAPVVINGRIATVEEMILRQWAASGNFQKQQAFMWYCHGKIPDDVNMQISTIVVEYVDDGANPPGESSQG
jgi:hypothetical protein